MDLQEPTSFLRSLVLLAALLLPACAAETEGATPVLPQASPQPSEAMFQVRGAVTGLTSVGLVVENNGGSAIALAREGTFAFTTPLANGASYAVTIAQQPEEERCAVMDGAGTIEDGDVVTVRLSCVPRAHVVGGTVTGLRSAVLLDNGGDALSVLGDGTFHLPALVAVGSHYDVTVLAQPDAPAQTCIVQNGRGTVGDADALGIEVTCADAEGPHIDVEPL